MMPTQKQLSLCLCGSQDILEEWGGPAKMQVRPRRSNVSQPRLCLESLT